MRPRCDAKRVRPVPDVPTSLTTHTKQMLSNAVCVEFIPSRRGLVITNTPVLPRLSGITCGAIVPLDLRRDQDEIANMGFLQEFLLRGDDLFKRICPGQ